MPITSGFYNSKNGDRKYNTDQVSVLLSSIIKDGVFQSIGTAFNVTVNSGSEVLIGKGYAWFNQRWIQNDVLHPLNLGASEVLLDRIDAVVIEINETESVRIGTIKQIKGTPSATPVRPTLTNADFIHQYPLAYILRPANNNNILTQNITSMIGTSECPFVIGVQETLDIDILLAQWGAQWSAWFTAKQTAATSDINTLITNSNNSMNGLFDDFDAWFQNMKNQLTTDAAGNLQNQINTINTNAGGWKTYSSLSEVNASLTSASTLNQIIPLMAEKSKLFLKNGQADYTGLGFAADVTYVEITKLGLDRVMIKAYRNYSNVTTGIAAEYFAVWDYATTTVKGFFKLMDSNDAYAVTYTSAAELGLANATATLASIWAALPAYTKAVIDIAILTSITFPVQYGTLVMEKGYANSRPTAIEFIPKESTSKYYMGVDSSNQPIGVWTQYATKTDLGVYATNAALGAYALKTNLGVQVAVQPTAPADATKLWVW